MSISTALFLLIRPALRSTLFPYTTLFRSDSEADPHRVDVTQHPVGDHVLHDGRALEVPVREVHPERHPGLLHGGEIGRATSELQSQSNLVCRLLLENKNGITQHDSSHRCS